MNCNKHPNCKLIPVQMDNGEIVNRCMLCDIKMSELKDKIKEIESRNLPSDEELESLKEDLEVLENN